MTFINGMNPNISSINKLLDENNINVIWDVHKKEVIQILTDDNKWVRDFKAFFINISHLILGYSTISGSGSANIIKSVLDEDIEPSEFNFEMDPQYSTELDRLQKYESLLLKYKIKQSFEKAFPKLGNDSQDTLKFNLLNTFVDHLKKLKTLDRLIEDDGNHLNELSELLSNLEKISEEEIKKISHHLDEDFGVNHVDLLLNYKDGDKQVNDVFLDQLINICKKHNCPKLFHSSFYFINRVIKKQAKKMELLNLMANNAPEQFKAALSVQDKEGMTLIRRAAKENDIELMELIANHAPEEFKAAMTLQDSKGKTPVHLAAENNNLEAMKSMAALAPEQFVSAMEIKDKIENRTPIHWAARGNQTKMMGLIADKAPEPFNEAIAMQDRKGMTLLHFAANNASMIHLLAKKGPEEFKTAAEVVDTNGNTPIHHAVENGNLETMTILHNFAPDEFKAAIRKQNENGNTPLHLAIGWGKDVVEFIDSRAPNEFRDALLIKNEYGITPFHVEVSKNSLEKELLELMAKREPAVLVTTNKRGETALDMVKAKRPHHYKDLTQLYKNGDESTQLFKNANKERVKRIETGHIFHFKGEKFLMKDQLTVSNLDLEGHHSQQWLHLMSKDAKQFAETHPLNADEKKQVNLLIETLDFSADSNLHSTAEKLERINKGLPTLINTGFSGHAATVLIWGNHFILCNRGSGSRRPVEVKNFDPKKLTVDLLKQMEKAKSKEDFVKLYYETLPNKLNFKPNLLYLDFIGINELPMQTVGNCSMESPVTAEYMMDLMGSVQGIQEDGRLLNSLVDKETKAERGEKGIALFHKMHTSRQLAVLRRLIEPSDFDHDHELIADAFKQVYALRLDEAGQNELVEITTKYLSSLDETEQGTFKTNLLSWVVLPKRHLF